MEDMRFKLPAPHVDLAAIRRRYHAAQRDALNNSKKGGRRGRP
jgi:hypothetical protein